MEAQGVARTLALAVLFSQNLLYSCIWEDSQSETLNLYEPVMFHPHVNISTYFNLFQTHLYQVFKGPRWALCGILWGHDGWSDRRSSHQLLSGVFTGDSCHLGAAGAAAVVSGVPGCQILDRWKHQLVSSRDKWLVYSFRFITLTSVKGNSIVPICSIGFQEADAPRQEANLVSSLQDLFRDQEARIATIIVAWPRSAPTGWIWGSRFGPRGCCPGSATGNAILATPEQAASFLTPLFVDEMWNM